MKNKRYKKQFHINPNGISRISNMVQAYLENNKFKQVCINNENYYARICENSNPWELCVKVNIYGYIVCFEAWAIKLRTILPKKEYNTNKVILSNRKAKMNEIVKQIESIFIYGENTEKIAMV